MLKNLPLFNDTPKPSDIGETMTALIRFERSLAPGIVYATEDKSSELMYLGLGISDEAGEVAGKIKKHWRGDYDLLADTEEGNVKRRQVAEELGDVMWYLTRMAHLVGYDLAEVMEINMQKLASRRERGVIHGDGDNR